MKKLLFKIISLIIAFSVTSAVYAAGFTCTFKPGNTPRHFNLTLPTISLTPNLQVGDVIYEEIFPTYAGTSTQTMFTCNGPVPGTITYDYRYVSPQTLSPLGNKIYNTNLPGIGIQVSVFRASGNTSEKIYPDYPTSTQAVAPFDNWISLYSTKIKIYKTAANPTMGTLQLGRTIEYVENNLFLYDITFNNPLMYGATTCSVSNGTSRTIDLSTVNVSNFSGLGSTTAPQNFNVDLACQGPQMAGANIVPSGVALSFNYTPEGANNQAISNTALATEKAQGVSSQLVWNYAGTTQVIANGDKFTVGNVPKDQTLNFSIPLIARYYQSGSTITAGKVKGLATFTIQYE